MKLYYHKTSGGAEYLTDTFTPWKHNGKSGKEGTVTDKTTVIVRIDGDITKDAEINGKRVNAFDALQLRLSQMAYEFQHDDHNLTFPNCNCESHQNYHAARALLASLE